MPYTLPFSMNPNYTWIIHGTRILNSSKLAVRRFVRPLPRRRAISKFRKQGFLEMRFEVSAARVSNFSEYHQIVSGRHLTRFQCQMGIVSSNSRNWALRRQDVSPPQKSISMRDVCIRTRTMQNAVHRWHRCSKTISTTDPKSTNLLHLLFHPF